MTQHNPITVDDAVRPRRQRAWSSRVIQLGMAGLIGLLTPAIGSAYGLDAEVRQLLKSSPSRQVHQVIMSFSGGGIPTPLLAPHISRKAQAKAAAVTMKYLAKARQHSLVAALEQQIGTDASMAYRSLWIADAVGVRADAQTIAALAAAFPEAQISIDSPLQMPVTPLAATPGDNTPLNSLWNLDAITARDMWTLGYRGAGSVIAVVDSGVDVQHADIAAAAYRGGTNSWCDISGTGAGPCNGLAFPADPGTGTSAVGGHGTAVMGLAVGGDTGGDPIGVAPDAQWVGVRIFDNEGNANVSDALAGLQWLIDLPANQIPDVVNMSWEVADVNAGTSCNLQPQLETAIQSLRSLEIFLVASSGNDTIAHLPAGYVEVFAVGATNQNNTVLVSTSGQGPSTCPGRGVGLGAKPYPNAVAPGDAVTSADLTSAGQSFYISFNGTSASAPHAAGAFALLRSAFPNATVTEIQSAMEIAAVGTIDPATSMLDNTVNERHGFGLLDTRAALDQLLLTKVAKVAGVHVAKTGADLTVSWIAAPDTGPAVTYTVQRNGVNVATALAGTSFVDTGAAGTNDGDTYTVLAVAGAITGPASRALLGNVNRKEPTTEGRVDGFDLVSVLGAVGTTNPDYDLNGDGSVNAQDVTLLKAQMGAVVTP